MKDQLSKTIEKCYLSGVMVTYKKIERDVQQFNNLPALINYLINYPLDELYHKHPRYSKEVYRRQTNKLIKDFIIPRKNKHLTNEIENVAIPFNIVQEKRKQYELKLNNKVFQDIINMINDGKWHGLDQIYQYIRLKPWGLQEIGLELIIASLISTGECKGQTKDGEIINSENFSRNLIGGRNLVNLIISISKGNLVNNTIWNEILEIMEILEINYVDKKTSLNQDKIWADLMKKTFEIKSKISSAYTYLLELGDNLNQYQDFLSNLEELDEFEKFIDDIECLKNQDSYDGLTNFRMCVLDKYMKINFFREKYMAIKELLQLAEERVDIKLKAYFNYFKEINSDSKEIKEILNGFSQLAKFITKPDKVRSFLGKIEGAKDRYRKEYIINHNNYYKNYEKYFAEITNLKEYKTLSLLENIEKIKIDPSLRERMKFIKNNYQSCQITLNEGDIGDRPYCFCKLPVDEGFVPIDLEKFREEFCSGIKEYHSTLKSGSYRKQINHYLESHQDSKLKQLLNVENYDLEKIIDLVDEKLIIEINQAFRAAYPVEIDINDIIKLFKGSILVSEIPTFSNKISSYLIQQVKEVIESQRDIKKEQIVIFFKNDTKNTIDQKIPVSKLNKQEEMLYSILERSGMITEEKLIEEMELAGYKGILPKGLVMILNNKYVNKYGVNLIEIKETDQTYYSIKKEEGISNA